MVVWEEATATATFLMDSAFVYIYIYTYTLWITLRFICSREKHCSLPGSHYSLPILDFLKFRRFFWQQKKVHSVEIWNFSHFPKDSPSFHGDLPTCDGLGLATTEEGKASSAWVWHGLALLMRPNGKGAGKTHEIFLDFQVVHWLGHLLFVTTEHKLNTSFPMAFHSVS